MSFWTTTGKADLLYNGISGSDVRALLVGVDHVPDPELEFVSDVVADEVAGTGYVRQVLTLSTPSDPEARTATLDAADVTYSSADFDVAIGMWVYRRVSNDATSKLWCYLDLLPMIITNGEDLTLTFGSRGISVI